MGLLSWLRSSHKPSIVEPAAGDMFKDPLAKRMSNEFNRILTDVAKGYTENDLRARLATQQDRLKNFTGDGRDKLEELNSKAEDAINKQFAAPKARNKL